MIHRTDSIWQSNWQQRLAKAFTSLEDLFDYLQLDHSMLMSTRSAAVQFGLKVPREFAALMKKGDINDPLLRQVLPSAAELCNTPGYKDDPVGDGPAMVAPGVIHKYWGRALLIVTGACGINCRYCFRRHFPYSKSSIGHNYLYQALDYLRENREIQEIILSGGDPLSLTDGRLAGLLEALEQIPHLTRLRVHSRLPVVLPHRLSQGLINLLTSSRFQAVLVLHINHAMEVSDLLIKNLDGLQSGAVTLLNQSVLLRGVNDSIHRLRALSEKLFSAGILPYYLHLLDPVRGAEEFLVPEPEAIALHRQLKDQLPGYLVPRLAKEVPGMASKMTL